MSESPKLRRISPSVVIDIREKARLVSTYVDFSFSLRKREFLPHEKGQITRYYKRIYGGKIGATDFFPLASLGKVFVPYRKKKGFTAALKTYAGSVKGTPRLKGQWIESAGPGTRVTMKKGNLVVSGKFVEKTVLIVDPIKLARAMASEDEGAVKRYFATLAKGVPEAAYLAVKNGQNNMGALPKSEALADAVNLVYQYSDDSKNNYIGNWFKGFEVLKPKGQRLPTVNDMADAIDAYRDQKGEEKAKQYAVRFKVRSKAEKKNRGNASEVVRLRAQLKALKAKNKKK